MATKTTESKLKSLTFPLHLPLSNKETPWRMSQEVFQKMSNQQANSNDLYKRVELKQSDPDFAFVLKYFQADCPENRAIGRIYCIHNSSQSNAFEHSIPTMEQEAKSSVFQPKWRDKEIHLSERTEAFKRFEKLSASYSPFSIQWDQKRKESYQHVKVLPLWHGSSAKKCDSICQTGFTYFGKHVEGTNQSTDQGYFGSGIYFTTSARYAADIYSDGQNLLLAWVSMREPFPVVADQAYPKKPSDMKMLEAKGAYENYNAHYVPVVSIDPKDKKCAVYYPCTLGQEPHCDEIVVFHKTQALTRYWIEIVVDLPQSPFTNNPVATVATFLDVLLKLLDNPKLKEHQELYSFLEAKGEFLLTIEESNSLSKEDLDFYNKIRRLTDESGNIRNLVAKSLMQLTSVTHSPKAPISRDNSVGLLPKVIQPALSQLSLTSLPLIAFGKAKWEQYFGDVGIEPTLPNDIETILNSQCPFWPDQKVGDTHKLVMIPKTVNGKLLTLEYIGQLVQSPKQGNKTKYGPCVDLYGREKTPVGESHWVLMTRDIIPDSRYICYLDQLQLVYSYNQKSGINYEVPKLLDATVCIFLEYVQSGTSLYPASPRTYTRCQESCPEGHMIVGGFYYTGLNIGELVDDYGSDGAYIGVGAFRKLF